MNTLDRRAFLASSGALVVGFSWSGMASAAVAPTLAPAKAVDKTRIESFIAIGGDGRATIYVGRSSSSAANCMSAVREPLPRSTLPT